MKVLLAVGSSGGHIVPALVFAQKMRSVWKQAVIVWVYQETQAAECFLKGVSDRKLALRRTGFPFGVSWGWMRTPAKFLRLAFASWNIVRRQRPDLVVGFGGSSSYFIARFAAWMGTPCLVHEQNVLPGRANRMLGSHVDRILTGFKECVDQFPAGRAVWTGNPVRACPGRASKPECRRELGLDPERITFLVLGGSQGARAINHFLFDIAPAWDGARAPQWIHVTGPHDYGRAGRSYARFKNRISFFEFSDEMEKLYTAADMVISRAGALTLSELALFGIGSLLIPYPYGGNHQAENARVFAQAGAALILEETLGKDRLRRELDFLVERPGTIRLMAESARRLACPDAADRMWNETQEIVTKYRIPNEN